MKMAKRDTSTIEKMAEVLREYPCGLKIDVSGSDFGSFVMAYFDAEPWCLKIANEEGEWADPLEVRRIYESARTNG